MATYNVVWKRWQEIEAENADEAREIVETHLMEAGIMDCEVDSVEEVSS